MSHSYLLTNRKGGYCLLSDSPQSKYSGVFFRINNKTFKVIEDIVHPEPLGKKEYHFTRIQRNRGKGKENIYLPENHNGIVYTLSEKKSVDLVLDIRESYDSREWGRNYEITEKKNQVIIKYTKKTDNREDDSQDQEEYTVYLAISANRGGDVEILDEWQKQSYPLDKVRENKEEHRFVYKCVRINAQRVAFAFSDSESKASAEAEYILKHYAKLDANRRHKLKQFMKVKTDDEEMKFAYHCAVNALEQLTTKVKEDGVETIGIYAGLPWFFQFWARDELISLGAHLQLKQYDTAKKILVRYLNAIDVHGRIPNRMPHSDLGSADAIFWLFKRVTDLCSILKKEKKLSSVLSKKDKELIKTKVVDTIFLIRKFAMKDEFVVNGPKETWMDTIAGDDTREGVRIEIQAMMLNLYRFAAEITKDEKYTEYEERLKKKVKKELFKKGKLHDGLNDPTQRPNIFLAAYCYPQLLEEKEWTLCFESALKELWLPWGGLATIAKDHPLYCDTYSGQDNKSYHRGDSWFFINNLAALVLEKNDKEKFKEYIEKIKDASIKEILHLGVIGTSAELSSAKELKSEASLSQAWSIATFIELVKTQEGKE